MGSVSPFAAWNATCFATARANRNSIEAMRSLRQVASGLQGEGAFAEGRNAYPDKTPMPWANPVSDRNSRVGLFWSIGPNSIRSLWSLAVSRTQQCLARSSVSNAVGRDQPWGSVIE
jgi:hypothetical protein